MNPIPDDPKTQYGYWMPTIVFDRSVNFNREKLLKMFRQNNIDGRVFFYPLSMMPMFEEKRDNKVSYDIYARAINLPTYHDIKSIDIERVSKIIKNVL